MSSDENVPYDAAIGDSGGRNNSSTESGDSKTKGAKEGKAPKQKKQKVEKQAEKGRGVRVMPEKRVKDHPGDFFFVKGQEMWCLVCQVPVCHRQTATISRHLKSAKHSERKRKFSATVFTPGPAAAVVNPPPSSQPAVTGV